MILCIGTTPTVQRTMVFERLRLDQVNRARTTEDYASGKSVNVARVGALLGAQVLATGFAGGDRGRFLLAGMGENNIAHKFQKVTASTRLCTTLIDEATGAVTELVEESTPVESADWARLSRLCLRLLRTHAISTCVLSGSLPPGGDLGFYPAVIRFAVGWHAKVILDTRGLALRESLGCPGFVVKLNRSELAETVGSKLGSDRALKSAMREITPKDGGSVIVTMGAAGAIAWDGAAFWTVPTPKVKAVNPIGSGDAFAAGLAVGFDKGLPFIQCLALASASGAANAMTVRAGVVDPAVVERLRRKVKVSEILT